MHVLITGGAGFIGSHIVEYHLNRGDSVLAVDDLSTGSMDNVRPFSNNGNFRFVEADILTWDGIEQAVGWSDRIYHMAAVVGMFKVLKEPIKTLAVNIAGTERIMRAAQACTWNPDILIASTSEVYGNRAEHRRHMGADVSEGVDSIELTEDMDPVVSGHSSSRSNYALSKMANELFALSYARQYDMSVRVVRFFNVIGPRQTGQYGMVAPRFVQRAVSGAPITVYGDGNQSRCFLDVRDAVTALDLLISNPESSGEIVNIGTQQEVTINQLAELVKELSPVETEIKHISYKEAYGDGFDEIFHRRPSVKKLHALTGFTPKWNLAKTLEYLIEEKYQAQAEYEEIEGGENGYHTIFHHQS
ncbi:MAG: NAD-dependent epimerase/dehydratase family protein [bacterium]|nr:NAD-dependent epimerase/dehydratase family protein [bacterium]